ncbi:MAG: FHA domain-containing protein [Anaerolineae bacterium]|jgi:hypothetical protein
MANTRQAEATLIISRGPGAGGRFHIGTAPAIIGRQDQCEVQVQDTWVSRQHARIVWTGETYVVEDLGSTNGTFVNGQRVVGSRTLRSGDHLQLGDQVELLFQLQVPTVMHEEPALNGMAPAPRSDASPPPAQAPLGDRKRRRTWIWVSVISGLLVVLIAAGVAYSLLSDNGQELAEIPLLRAVLPEPTSTPSAVPPTPTPTPTLTPRPTATPTPQPLSIEGEAFEADVQDTCSVDVAITEVVGNGLRIEVLSGSIRIHQGGLTIWCYGAKHTWIGSLTYGGYTFESDPDTPLQFILDRDEGYSYLSGRGRVVQSDGSSVELPQ